ncbi:unnamed protein product, partial [Trichobilharzia regenti]
YCEEGVYYTQPETNKIFCAGRCRQDVYCGPAKVPDKYLKDCYVNGTDGKLQLQYPKGDGAPSSGYLLFVEMLNTHHCSRGAGAYAHACILDPETDRYVTIRFTL